MQNKDTYKEALDKAVKLRPDLRARSIEIETILPREKVKRSIEDAAYRVKDLD